MQSCCVEAQDMCADAQGFSVAFVDGPRQEGPSVGPSLLPSAHCGLVDIRSLNPSRFHRWKYAWGGGPAARTRAVLHQTPRTHTIAQLLQWQISVIEPSPAGREQFFGLFVEP